MNKFSKLFLGSILALGLASCGEKPTPTPEPQEKVNVTFDYNYETFDETATSPAAKVVEVVKGEKVAKPSPDPEWEGWRFVQWCTTVAAVMPFDFDSAILADTTVYAKWAEEGADFDSWAVVGAFGGDDQWNVSSTTYEMATEDGLHYTISDVSMKENTEFKIVKNHEWTAADINGAKVNAEASTEGCFADAGNVKILLSGVYKLDLDLTNATSPLTLTKTGDLDIQNLGYSVNVLGAFNGWGPQNADVEGNGHLAGDVALSGTYTGVVAIEAHQQFKVTVLSHFDDGSTGIEWFGPGKYAALVDDVNVGSIGEEDPNYEALKNGNYTFTVVIPAEGTKALTISVTVEEVEPSEKPAYEKVGLVGSNNGWGDGGPDTPFIKDESKRLYTLTADLIEGGEYKVRPNDTWNGDIGYGALTNKVDGTKIADKGGNINILVAGSYDFAVEYDEMNKVVSFTLVAHGETPVAREFRPITYKCFNNDYDLVDMFGVDLEASTLPEEGEVGEKVHFKFVAAEGYVYSGFQFWDETDNQILDGQIEDHTVAEFDITVVDFTEIICIPWISEAVAPVATVVTFTAGIDKGTQTGGTTDTITKEGVTVTAVDSPLGNNDNYRIYAHKSMTISVESGNITKIVITCTASGSAKYGPGNFTLEGYTVDGTVGTWEGSAASVTFSDPGQQVRITSIVVTVAK